MRECMAEDINEILLSFKHSTGGGGGESKFGGAPVNINTQASLRSFGQRNPNGFLFQQESS